MGRQNSKKFKQGAGGSKLAHLKVMSKAVVAKSKLEIHNFEFLKILVAKRKARAVMGGGHPVSFARRPPPLENLKTPLGSQQKSRCSQAGSKPVTGHCQKKL